MRLLRKTLSFLILASLACAQETAPASEQSVHLTVAPGVPLRLFVTKRFSKKLNAPVEAKLLTPVYAFDREVIAAGSTVRGHVAEIRPVSRWERIHAVLGGDFTPLHAASVDFTSILMPDGTAMPVHTVASSGLNSLVPYGSAKQPKTVAQDSQGGALATGKQQIKDQVNARIASIRSIPSMVRSRDKKEWLYDFAMSKLPYHPQYVRARTRFDAELLQPVDFGSATVPKRSLALLGTQPASDASVHARLLTTLDSRSSMTGEKLEAVLEEPLFSGNHNLVLPEGTRLDGVVVLAKRAGWFHHGGHLRFRFQDVRLSQEVEQLMSASSEENHLPQSERILQFRTQGLLTAAESTKSPLKVDKEGEVQAKESKTRFIGTIVSLMIARAAADNDPTRSSTGAITGTSSNVGGRTLGGGMGFGLLGSIASQSSRNVGTAFGYYGLAWSVFSTVIAHGAEVQFQRNSAVDIGFNARPVAGKTKTGQDVPTGVR